MGFNPMSECGPTTVGAFMGCYITVRGFQTMLCSKLSDVAYGICHVVNYIFYVRNKSNDEMHSH